MVKIKFECTVGALKVKYANFDFSKCFKRTWILYSRKKYRKKEREVEVERERERDKDIGRKYNDVNLSNSL